MLPGALVILHRLYDCSVEVLENANLTFQFIGPWLSGMDILITVDPENINYILSSNFSNYIKGPEYQEVFEAYGDGIVNSDLELYMEEFEEGFSGHIRRSRSKLKDGLVPLFNHFAKEEMVVDLQDVFQRFMFDTTFISLTGFDMKSLSLEMPEVGFANALDDVGDAIMYRHITPRFLWKLQKWIGVGREKKMTEANATFDRVCATYVSAKRDEIKKGKSGEDLLTLFMKLDTIETEDQASNTGEIPLLLDSLGSFGICLKTLDESLRLFPPIPFERKSPIKPDVLPSGHKVKSATNIMFFIYAMGRMKTVWGEDAMEFKPERWISETGGFKHQPSYKFLSFNAAPRTCLGKNLAINLMKAVIVEILQNYEIKVINGQKIEPKPGLVLYMKHGLKVTITKKCSSLE
ncbi:hypothetical protein YC2023_017098 [Brassica napus]